MMMSMQIHASSLSSRFTHVTQSCQRNTISSANLRRGGCQATRRVDQVRKIGLRTSKRTSKRNSTAITALQQTQGFDEVVLVGDIGGTNCRFVLWEINLIGGAHKKLHSQVYLTEEYPAFEDALAAFSKEELYQQHPPKSAAFACAGPVLENRCEMTNLAWIIDGLELTKKLGMRVAVLNDFEAVGYGIPALNAEDLVILNDAPVIHQAPKAVMGPGTGLGEAQLMWDQDFGDYRVWPSEGSHASFAPRGDRQRQLSAFVESEITERTGEPRGYSEVELVACGSGLVRIFNFLVTAAGQEMPKVGPKGKPVQPRDITHWATEGNPQAVEAVELLLEIVGAEAGHMGLRSLADGGIYICGGIIAKMVEKGFKMDSLLAAFLQEGHRFHKVLKRFPLYVVKNESLGLMGAREYAIKLLTNPDVCK